MKQVLVIAYYFPPMGLSGIQRTLKFVKYLPDFGWRPTVLTITPHAYYAFDDSFLHELDGRPIDVWRTEPGGIFAVVGKRRTISLSNERLRKALNRISQLVFIPDNKIGWRKQVRAFLERRDMRQFDLVYATAPPFTDHLIGMDVKRRYAIPFVADFRDAWVEYPYHYYWTAWHRRRHERLESEVVASADAVITTNKYVRTRLLSRSAAPGVAERVHVITQGFDPMDFEKAAADTVTRLDPSILNIVFTGIFYEDRDPLVMFNALQLLRRTRPDTYNRIRFYMIGYVQQEYQEMGRRLGIDDSLVYCGYLEHHAAVAWVKSADVLWFNIGSTHAGYQTVSPGKAFEYLGSAKPIVAVLPENEIREILSGFDHTFIVEPGDHVRLAAVLDELVERHARGDLPIGDMRRIAHFDRRSLTGRMASIFDAVASSTSVNQHST